MFKNFNLSWFLTTPGILTSLGCLLIVISIIIFISSFLGKKGKKDKNIPNENIPIKELDAEVTSTPDVMPENKATNVAETVPVTSSVVDTPPPVAQDVTPVETPTPVASDVTPVEIPTPVAPDVTPVVENSTPSVNQVNLEGFGGINIEPTITPVEQNVTLNNTTSSVEPVVYGGASPKVEPVNDEPTEKVIYGGADPLAGTGIIPTVESTTSKAKEEIESL